MKSVSLFFALPFLLIPATLAKTQTAKQTLPDPAALRQATKLCKEVYGDEYARAKSECAKQNLAAKLLAKARQSDDERVMQFVLLRLARDIATQANDGPTALEAVDAMDEVFTVDAIEMKSSILATLAAATKLPSRHKYIAQQTLRVLAKAVAADNFDGSARLGEQALAEAGLARDRKLLALVQGRIDEATAAAAMYEEVKGARQILEKSPRDPAANAIVGKYLCFIKNDWEKGVRRLLHGNDVELKAAAKLEIVGAASSREQAALGDTWWDLAEKEPGSLKTPLLRRAGYWYQGAAPGLSGIESDKVEKRLNAISPLAAQDTAIRSLSTTSTVGGSGGQGFEDIPWGQCPLVGFNVTTTAASCAAADVSITSMQPIYAVAGGSLATKIYGKVSDTTAHIVAKPGYAVGGVVADSRERVNGLRLVFMRIKEGTLDRTDFYVSDWLGGHGVRQEVRLGCNGKWIVGVYGNCGRELKGVGFIQSE